MQWSEYIAQPDRGAVRRLWESLSAQIPDLALPVVFDGRGEYEFDWALTWDSGDECFTIELTPAESIEWFWCRRCVPRTCEGTDDDAVAVLPLGAIRRLESVSKALAGRR